MPELAADAARLLDALEVESAHVLGASFGGMVAQELAIRFPERVRALVLAGATPGGPRAVLPNLEELAAILGQAALALPREGPPWIGALLFSPEFRRRHPERVRELVPLFLRHLPPPWGLAARWWASVYHDTVSRLPEIQAPTLVMHGERDGTAPVGAAHLLAERIPDAELAIVPEAGHAFALEAPEETLRTCLEWLDRRARARRAARRTRRERRAAHPRARPPDRCAAHGPEPRGVGPRRCSSKGTLGQSPSLEPVTPGAVVFRNEVFELLQYEPQTERVREVPLLVVPQMINKYYIADLSPGQSLLEWAVKQGEQTFAISWRNPDERHSDWSYDTYCRAMLDALETVEEITGTDTTHVLGLCAGARSRR